MIQYILLEVILSGNFVFPAVNVQAWDCFKSCKGKFQLSSYNLKMSCFKYDRTRREELSVRIAAFQLYHIRHESILKIQEEQHNLLVSLSGINNAVHRTALSVSLLNKVYIQEELQIPPKKNCNMNCRSMICNILVQESFSEVKRCVLSRRKKLC